MGLFSGPAAGQWAGAELNVCVGGVSGGAGGPAAGGLNSQCNAGALWLAAADGILRKRSTGGRPDAGAGADTCAQETRFQGAAS